jgi:hypothetical protein
VQGVAGQHQRREGQGDVGAHAAAVAQCAHGGATREASTGHLGDMGHANWEATEKEGTRLDSGGRPGWLRGVRPRTFRLHHTNRLQLSTQPVMEWWKWWVLAV